MAPRVVASAAIVVLAVSGGGALIGASNQETNADYRLLYSKQRVFDDTQTFKSSQTPVTLHKAVVVTHGGTVRIEWYDGGWQPREPRSGSYVGLKVDRRRVASALLGTRKGRHETQAGTIIWAARLPAGTHTVELALETTGRSAALPYAPYGGKVPDSLVIEEFAG